MDEFTQIIKALEKRIEALERQATLKNITLPTDGKLVVPVMSSDPVSPVNGQVWINSTSHQLKYRENGVTKIVTAS